MIKICFCNLKIAIKPLFLALSLLLTSSLGATTPSKNQEDPFQALPLEELRTFSQVYYFVKSTYVEEVDDKALITAAIKGMVTSLDRHSRFLDASALINVNQDNNGEYAGVGLSFIENKQGLEISKVIKNSPADRQAIRQGMIVTHINATEVRRLTREDAFKLLKGKVNSQVKLTLINPSQVQQPNTATDYYLVREVIELPSIHSNLLPGNVGYLAISQFTKKTADEFTHAVASLSKEEPISKLIIDLRNNPGGVLETAIQISDLFINSGKLLTASGRTEDANETFVASSLAPYHDFDVVIMMNENSASSSEILAAALQDHNRATILGDISYGKGSIQSIYFLPFNAGLKITTANYYSPKGHKIQDVGIKPDVLFKTAGLENHQQNEQLDDLELLQAFQLISAKQEE